MDELNEIELTLLEGLTTKYPALKPHIPYLKVSKREITNSGMIVNFSYVNSIIQPEEIYALYSKGENIEINNLKHGLSYVIDVTDGEIKHIEFLTYGEKWDGKFSQYNIKLQSEH